MTEFGTCHRCGHVPPAGERIMVAVLHRDRFDNGHRAETRPVPLCRHCALELTTRYDLDTDDAIPGMWVEGYYGDNVLEAR